MDEWANGGEPREADEHRPDRALAPGGDLPPLASRGPVGTGQEVVDRDGGSSRGERVRWPRCEVGSDTPAEGTPQLLAYPVTVNLHPPLEPDDAEPELADPFEARLHRKARLVLAYRLFGAMGWGEQGDGHISARDPERHDAFWLLRYGVAFGDAKLSDLVLVGPDGDVLEGDGGINPSAYNIHWPIHEARPDVVCVAHTHTPYGTPWSACAEPFSMICQEALAFWRRHSVFDDGEVDVQSTDGGKRIAGSLGDGRLSILRNHGLLTVGANVDEAVGWYLMAERVAEVHCKAPTPRPISDDDARRCATTIADPATAWHAFNWTIRARSL